ncbi:MAG: WGR domain-containing protein [Saprospiraceae bacterium]|nr:WGR domain-containing protein [Saprospiraceae bacterium]
MISKHLKYIDDNSDKFWNIKTNETDVIITYGKNGTAGTTLLKKFETVEIAEKEALKLISEKIKKGYSESGEVIIANKNNDNKTTEKIDTKKNLEDELKLLIFTKNVNGVQDFLDKSTKVIL